MSQSTLLRATPVIFFGFCFAVGGTGVVAGALLRRRLDFRTQFFIDTASYVIGYGAIASTLSNMAKDSAVRLVRRI